MHELTIAQALVAQVEAALEVEPVARVRAVYIVLGPFSGVDRAALEMAFPFAAENTVLADAGLVVEDLPVTIECGACASVSEASLTHESCPECGSQDIAFSGDRDIVVLSVDVEAPRSVG